MATVPKKPPIILFVFEIECKVRHLIGKLKIEKMKIEYFILKRGLLHKKTNFQFPIFLFKLNIFIFALITTK